MARRSSSLAVGDGVHAVLARQRVAGICRLALDDPGDVKVRCERGAGVADVSDPVTLLDAFTQLDQDLGLVTVEQRLAAAIGDLGCPSVARLPARVSYDSVTRGVDWIADSSGDVHAHVRVVLAERFDDVRTLRPVPPLAKRRDDPSVVRRPDARRLALDPLEVGHDLRTRVLLLQAALLIAQWTGEKALVLVGRLTLAGRRIYARGLLSPHQHSHAADQKQDGEQHSNGTHVTLL